MMMCKMKYICTEDFEVFMGNVSSIVTFKVNDIVYIKFAYDGAFGKRYLLYLSENGIWVGSLYGDEINKFMEYRDFIINKIIEID